MNRLERLVWLSMAAAVGLRIFTFFWFPLTENTESRYAEIGRYMAASGDWITMWIDEETPFWGKPPLSAWMTSLGVLIFGVNEWSVRLPHSLAALVVLYLTWHAASQFNRQVALSASALLAGSLVFVIAMGSVMTDMALVLGTTLAFWGFWQVIVQGHRWGGYGFFVGIAIGLLAKGPLTLVLVGTPIVLWLLFQKDRFQIIGRLPLLLGVVIVCVLALPWYVLAELKTPGFLQYFIIGEHFNRFIVPGWDGDLYGNAHNKPKGSIWLLMAFDALPWLILLPFLWFWRNPSNLSTNTNETQVSRISYWWWVAFFPAVFFTFASNILWTYVLPAWPALVIGVAVLLNRYVQAHATQTFLVIGLLFGGMAPTGFLAHYTWTQQYYSSSARPIIAVHTTILTQTATAGPLYFYPDTTASARFYSNGAVSRLRMLEGIPELLNTHSHFYLVIRTVDRALLENQKGFEAEYIDTFGPRDLYRIVSRVSE